MIGSSNTNEQTWCPLVTMENRVVSSLKALKALCVCSCMLALLVYHLMSDTLDAYCKHWTFCHSLENLIAAFVPVFIFCPVLVCVSSR